MAHETVSLFNQRIAFRLPGDDSLVHVVNALEAEPDHYLDGAATPVAGTAVHKVRFPAVEFSNLFLEVRRLKIAENSAINVPVGKLLGRQHIQNNKTATSAVLLNHIESIGNTDINRRRLLNGRQSARFAASQNRRQEDKRYTEI